MSNGIVLTYNRCSKATGSERSENCPRTEGSIENRDSPTMGFGESLYFSVALCPRNCFAWPATL